MGLETAIGASSLAITGGTAVMSFLGAGEQKAKQGDAEAAAARAMKAARDRLSINYTDKMAIKKEPYELQREALLSQGAMAIQAGAESDRGAAPTAGKVQMAQNEAQAGIRTEMGKEMTDIEKQQIEEQSRLRDLNTQLDLGQVEGANVAAANASEAAAAANQQGFQGVASTLQQGLSMVPLFMKKDVITTSGGDSGPGANSAFQSPVADRYSNRGSIPGAMQNQNPFSGYYPQAPQPGTQYGIFGINYSGVGGH